jgi:aminobenzoyl-glutamate utilization protein B
MICTKRFGSLRWVILLCGVKTVFAQMTPEKTTSGAWIKQNEAKAKEVNQRIWNLAELGLVEQQSSQTLMDWLAANGFGIERGVANMPTAFIASFGSGQPLIAILAEYDALPGLSQKASPIREAREGVANGHACGHSIYGTASTTAAIAASQAMAKHDIKGTIRLYGTPAEETGISKIYMTKEGLFKDCDAVLHWHASDETRSSYGTTKALVSVKFTFRGLAAHASRSPHEGKSALDAVELMDIGANFLREHLPEDSRMHYVITDGGGQPNVVPPSAQVWYYLRADKHRDVEYMFQRLADVAKGAALMTSTTVEWHVDSDTHEILPNLPLSQLIHKNLELVGPPKFTEQEKIFARKTQESLKGPFTYTLSETLEKFPDEPEKGKASTDVGDVSWMVPTGGLTVASYTFGAPGHSWQIVACTGTSIGEKGMLVAAHALAYSALDLLAKPDWLKKARADFEQRKAGYNFASLIPEGQKVPAKIK